MFEDLKLCVIFVRLMRMACRVKRIRVFKVLKCLPYFKKMVTHDANFYSIN